MILVVPARHALAQAPAADASSTLLSLSVTARAPVPTDRLHAQMTASAVGATPAAASAALNRMVADARKAAASEPTVRMLAGTISVTRRDPPAKPWQADQQLTLDAQDGSDAVLRAAGALQALNIGTDEIGWTASPSQVEAAADAARNAALKQLAARARADAAVLGLHFLRFRTIASDDQDLHPLPAMRAMVAKAPQVDRPDDAGIAVTLRGEAVLGP